MFPENWKKNNYKNIIESIFCFKKNIPKNQTRENAFYFSAFFETGRSLFFGILLCFFQLVIKVLCETEARRRRPPCMWEWMVSIWSLVASVVFLAIYIYWYCFSWSSPSLFSFTCRFEPVFSSKTRDHVFIIGKEMLKGQNEVDPGQD